MKRNIAIIPARGGSKRIPGKNILDFNGRPMIAWTIDAALESGIFDKVLVSTDSEEIAEVGLSLGASVPFLRQGSADDNAPSSEATLGSLMQAEKYWNGCFDFIAQLMPNCPLRTALDIRKSFDSFYPSDSNFQISVFRFGWMNPWWAMKMDESGAPQPLFREALESRSQDLDPLYCPTGALWIAERASFVAAGTFYGPNYRLCELPWLSGVDIDDYDDLRMADACFNLRKNGIN